MKIIMYQDNKKFAVRGTTKVKVSATDYMGGEYSFDEAFEKCTSRIQTIRRKTLEGTQSGDMEAVTHALTANMRFLCKAV